MPEDIHLAEDPSEIRWADNRSLLLTIRYAVRVLRGNPDLATDLLARAHADARQIIENADLVIKAVRGNSPTLRRSLNDLAESIEGELDADDDVEDQESTENE